MRKWVIVLLCAIGSITGVHAQSDTGIVYIFCYFKGNGEDGLHLAYSRDALHWTALHNDSAVLRPAVGKDKLMRDPCIIRGGDGKFHMVWTVSWKEKGIGYASSEDLVHWTPQQYIPVMEHEATAQNAWAPELTYDTGRKRYVIYWATTIPGRFPTTDTTGDHNHRIYYTTTKNFQQYKKTKLFYDKGFNVIDATIRQNGKGYVMFLKDETKNPVQKNIRVATSKKLEKRWSGPSTPITGSYWAEGPTALFVKDRWIVYFDKYREHKYGAVSSSDLRSWTDISEQVSFPKGTRHGTVFTISQEEWTRLVNTLQ